MRLKRGNVARAGELSSACSVLFYRRKRTVGYTRTKKDAEIMFGVYGRMR